MGQHVRIPSKQAAIKILHLLDVDEQQFQHEAETTERLKHPNIVPLLDFDVQQGTPFLVLDYAPGGSLRARHPKGSQVPLATVIGYLKEIVPALQHAHDQHILHRDIKPDNILIGQQGELLLSDFGICPVVTDGPDLAAQVLQALEERPTIWPPNSFVASQRKPVINTHWQPWSTSGSVAPFLLAKETGFSLAINISMNQCPHSEHLFPPCLPSVETVVMKALSKQPQDRFPSIQAFAEALEEASKRPPVGTRLLVYRGHGNAYTRGVGLLMVPTSPSGVQAGWCWYEMSIPVPNFGHAMSLLAY